MVSTVSGLCFFKNLFLARFSIAKTWSACWSTRQKQVFKKTKPETVKTILQILIFFHFVFFWFEVRHPMYTDFFIFTTALWINLYTNLITLIACGGFFVYMMWRIPREDELLRRLFGSFFFFFLQKSVEKVEKNFLEIFHFLLHFKISIFCNFRQHATYMREVPALLPCGICHRRIYGNSNSTENNGNSNSNGSEMREGFIQRS